ncbi:MAG: hypothetical protein ACXVNM_04805 [Bacteroidia bacterium]
MNTPLTKILLKCPYSGEYFEQKRSNQFFRSPKDGTAFRNLLKFFNDPEYINKQKAALFNLKRLVRFSRIGWTTLDHARFKMLRLKPDGLNQIPNKISENPNDNLFEVFGFWVQCNDHDKEYYIIPPEGVKGFLD